MSQGMTFTGSISFADSDPSYRYLDISFTETGARITSVTRYDDVQPLVMHFSGDEAKVVAYLVNTLRQQGRDAERLHRSDAQHPPIAPAAPPLSSAS